MPNLTKSEVTEILNRIAYHSFFRQGKQYVTIGKKEYKVNAILNLLRCLGAI